MATLVILLIKQEEPEEVSKVALVITVDKEMEDETTSDLQPYSTDTMSHYSNYSTACTFK